MPATISSNRPIISTTHKSSLEARKPTKVEHEFSFPSRLPFVNTSVDRLINLTILKISGLVLTLAYIRESIAEVTCSDLGNWSHLLLSSCSILSRHTHLLCSFASSLEVQSTSSQLTPTCFISSHKLSSLFRGSPTLVSRI